MAYDMVTKDGRASSNSPLPDIVHGLKTWYLDAGVPSRQVVLALPLYGYSFPCVGPGHTAGEAAPRCQMLNAVNKYWASTVTTCSSASNRA